MTADSEKTLLLRATRMILPSRVVDDGALLIQHGRIKQVLDASERQLITADRMIDLSDAVLFPGFIDVHLHGAVGVDVMAASAADLRRVSEFLLTQGVTAWLPTLVPAADHEYEQAVNSIATSIVDEPQAPVETHARARILGVHYEGPFVNSEQCGALHAAHFRTFAGKADVDSLPALSLPGAIHLMTLAPEIDGGVDLVRDLIGRSWIVSLGHTRADLELLNRAHEAGARHMTHFMNAMPSLHHRRPGPVGWGLAREDVTCDIIADGVHLDPLMLRLLLKIKSSDRLMLISDAMAAAGAGDGDYQIWGETISVVNGRTRNAHGSIAGSVITMLDAVRMMLSLGVSEVELARMSASNPARLLGIDHDCGSIEEGKRADLVGLNQDGKIRFAMVGGSLAFGLWS